MKQVQLQSRTQTPSTASASVSKPGVDTLQDPLVDPLESGRAALAPPVEGPPSSLDLHRMFGLLMQLSGRPDLEIGGAIGAAGMIHGLAQRLQQVEVHERTGQLSLIKAAKLRMELYLELSAALQLVPDGLDAQVDAFRVRVEGAWEQAVDTYVEQVRLEAERSTEKHDRPVVERIQETLQSASVDRA